MTAETGAGVASKISLRPVFDDVAGSVQYLTKVSTYFVSDMLPKSATVGQRWLCQADGNIYEVAVAASGSAYAQLTLVGPKAVSVVEPWDGATVPDDGDEVVDANFPDASYYAVPGGLVDGSEAPTLAFLSDSAYVSVRDLDIGPDEFQVSQNERPADTYAAIAAAGKTFTPSVVGGSPQSSLTVLYARQGEVGVTNAPQDPINDARRTALLKFYRILDASGKLTEAGAALDNRILADAAATGETAISVDTFTAHIDNPQPGGTDITCSSATATYDPTTGVWTEQAESWYEDPQSQLVDFEGGTNQSTGFFRGRKTISLTPTFGTPTRTADGFTVQITNYDAAFTWSGTATASGSVAISNTGLVTVTGVAAGTSSRATIKTVRTGYADDTAKISATSLNAALTPTFGTPTRTADGYTVQISNYNSAYTWAGTATASGVVAISGTGLVTVTGVAADTSSTATITTTRTGYVGGTADVTAKSLA